MSLYEIKEEGRDDLMDRFPPFHPEAVVTFWLTTPGLNVLDPHLTLTVIACLAIFIFFKKKKKRAPIDSEEQMFQALLQKRKILESQLVDLENDRVNGKISVNHYEKNVNEYKKQLEKVKKELIQFT